MAMIDCFKDILSLSLTKRTRFNDATLYAPISREGPGSQSFWNFVHVPVPSKTLDSWSPYRVLLRMVLKGTLVLMWLAVYYLEYSAFFLFHYYILDNNRKNK